MNYIDIAILAIIGFGALIGFKRGFTRQLVSTVGFIVVAVLAFKFKGVVSEFFYQNLPFFKFGGYFKGVSALNILVYEAIAFFVVLSVLMIVLRLVMLATSIFEKLLNATIILGIPSKLAGAVVGAFGHFILVFIVLYIVSFPTFNQVPLEESKYTNAILTKTPLLSGFIDETMEAADEIYSLKGKYTEAETNEFNLETLDLLLKYKIVSVETLDELVEKDKLQIDNIESVIRNYR